MRAKLSYKSKRNIVIALIIMVLFAASVTTTYFFIKGKINGKNRIFKQVVGKRGR